MAAVEGRIKALSHAHMLLSESRWEGADLGRLVREELDPYRVGDAVSTEGPETILDPRRAQTLALAIHELATNAAKYGAPMRRRASKIDLARPREWIDHSLAGIRWPPGADARHSRVWHKKLFEPASNKLADGLSSIGSPQDYIAAYRSPR